MALKRPQLPSNGRLLRLSFIKAPQDPLICPFCSLLPTARVRLRSKGHPPSSRNQSTATSPTNPRAELEKTLLELQKRYPAYLHVSRLQLALQSLRSKPGDEAVRIAVLGLAGGAHGSTTARRVARALLADPLKDEEAWEAEIGGQSPYKPLVVRVDPPPPSGDEPPVRFTRSSLLQEVHVSSAMFRGSKLELLLMDIDPISEGAGSLALPSVQESLLVPSVEIPSEEGRVTAVTTPVHSAILVAEGFSGAINISKLSKSGIDETVKATVNMPDIPQELLDTPLDIIDVAKAEQGIKLFREGPQNAVAYEHLWSASNVPALASWLKSGIQSTDDATKPVVRKHIASLLRDTLAAAHAVESQKISTLLSSAVDPTPSNASTGELAAWSQNAHAELQNELDVAFASRRWRKIGWWKLFWRVDDVALLTGETLSQRFLPTAEQELVYLAGRIEKMEPELQLYPVPVSSRDGSQDPRSLSSEELPATTPSVLPVLSKWPTHIAFTRRYLQNETVPALQALAQKLVAQSVGTSSIAASLAALLYFSSAVSTLYEAGAVAALGIVYSLGRLQKKWETAQGFWEGEVREEGRKAVRAAEESVAQVLERVQPTTTTDEAASELKEVQELVTKAEDALARMK